MTLTLPAMLLVFVGAGLGGVARHATNLWAAQALGLRFPVGTLTVNVIGSVLMGVLAGALAHRLDVSWAEPARLFLGVGLLGGFTTFSAFSLDAMALFERGDVGLAVAYVAASVVLSIGGLGFGLMAARAFS